MNLFDFLKGNKTQQPQMDALQFDDSGNIDYNKSLALQNQTQPLTMYDRLFGRTLTKDIDTQTINPETGNSELTTTKYSNTRPGFFNDLSSGYSENLNTPVSLNNFGQKRNWATRIGEGLGSLARFGQSPLGRSLLMGGAVLATGGSPLQAMAYGTSTGALNQRYRTADQLYRNELENQGFDTSNIRGYVTDDVFKNYANANYRNRNLDARLQLGVLKDNTSRAKMISTLLNNGEISPKEALEQMQIYGIDLTELDTSNATKLLPYKQKFYGDTSARGWANIGIRQDEVDIKKRKENREAKEFKTKEEMINELTGGNKSSKGGKVF